MLGIRTFVLFTELLAVRLISYNLRIQIVLHSYGRVNTPDTFVLRQQQSFYGTTSNLYMYTGIKRTY